MTYKIALVTTSRADFGIYRRVLDALMDEPEFDIGLIVSGMHMAPAFGFTAAEVRTSPFPIWAEIDILLASDSEAAAAKSMGIAIMGYSEQLARIRPDLLIVLGDRFEMHSAAAAAVPMRIPIAHIHGGEETEGAIDNVFRHSMTKMAHLHFPATALAARRIAAMGEAPDQICVSGAPGLDNIRLSEKMTGAELASTFGIPESGFILVTYHPVTLEPQSTLAEFETIWTCLNNTGRDIVFTAANADPAGQLINARIAEICAESQRAYWVESFGARGYYSAMRHARCMVGNSSSGIIEAASLGLPVVNIGSRQEGREQSENTINASDNGKEIAAALSRALSDEFQNTAKAAPNIYGAGTAGPKIAARVKTYLRSGADVRKHFHLIGQQK